MNQLANYFKWKLTKHFPKKWLIDQLSKIVFRLDTTDYFFDAPKLDYQPLPWIGIPNANIRGDATIYRWQKIKPFIKKSQSKSLQDIGSCYGFFCISATEQLGMQTIGIDANEKYLRIASHATPKDLREKCRFINLLVNKDTAVLLPQTDTTLCLSVWHHWVSNYGLKTASEILKEVWNHTNKELYFESGEEEVAIEFNLPFSEKPAGKWLEAYLQTTLQPKSIDLVGRFFAGNYKHYHLKKVKRHVFRLVK